MFLLCTTVLYVPVQPPNLDQQQSRPPPIPPPPPSASPYTELLHHQLSSTTVMCSELLQNHGSLLQALHQQLSALPYIQDQLIWLNQYYESLRNYHQYLAGAFAQVSNMSAADDTMRAGASGGEGGTTPVAEPRRSAADDTMGEQEPVVGRVGVVHSSYSVGGGTCRRGIREKWTRLAAPV